MNAGQIKLGSERGDFLYKLCKLDDIKTVVEIGTWHGGGSTACILESLKHKKVFEFFTFEINRAFYDIAVSNKPNHPNVHFIYGSIVKEDELLNVELDIQRQAWLEEDIANIKLCPYVLDVVPLKIDLLVLDGGEFASKKELELLQGRSKYIFLDDTFTLKNNYNRSYLLENSDYYCIHDALPTKDHNGWSVFFKKVTHYENITCNSRY